MVKWKRYEATRQVLMRDLQDANEEVLSAELGGLLLDLADQRQIDPFRLLEQVLDMVEAFGELNAEERAARERLPSGFWFARTRVYPALRALERSGYLRAEERHGPWSESRGGRPRYYYRPTTLGVAEVLR